MDSTPTPEQPAADAAVKAPRWRRDFPIDWEQDDAVARRDFTKFLVLTSLAFVCGQAWIFAQTLFRRRPSRMPELAVARTAAIPEHGVVTFNYPNEHDNCVLVRTGPSTFVAYDQKCTHLSCPVRPVPEAGTLVCPCHDGIFDLATGRPLSGPPRRPLPIVELRIEEGVIYATGIQERG